MKGILKKLAMVMAMIIVVTSINVPSTAKAAKAPTLNVTKTTITEKGKTYKLTVKNQKAGCKYTWKSSNKKIATVTAVKGKNGSANVKALKNGKATISCTITYSTGTKRTLKATITVKIPAKKVDVPATSVKINNAKLENNVQTITLGEAYDFDAAVTPSNSTDKVFFSVVPSDAGTITDEGLFTPSKADVTCNIYAVAAKTKEVAATSTVKDMVNVKVVAKSASVTGVSMNGADEILVNFSVPVNQSTVVDSSTKQLTSAVTIAPARDSKGNLASDFGTLTGSLSSDGKTLSIKCSKTYKGVYSISITADVKAQDGTPFTPYVKTISLVDTEPPVYLGTTIDDTGRKSSINFSEALDVSGMTIANVQCNSGSLTSIEKETLKSATNYVLSKDKKSLIIDLTSIATQKTSRTFTIQIQGIKDLAGNTSPNNFIQATVIIDTTTKSQASVVNITRTSYDTLTVEFSRAIEPYGYGRVTINNITIYTGVVDSENNKLVHYTIPADAAILTGPQTVTVQGWKAYNSPDNDTSANTPVSRTVNFSVDKSAPAVSSAKLVNSNGQYTLILEYTKPVKVVTPKGNITAKVITTSDDIYPNNIIGYSATVLDKVVTLVLDNKQMTLAGTYEFNIPEGFVCDMFLNKSAKQEFKLVSSASSDTKLPAPTKIEQSTTDRNIISVTFNQKLDITSAENVSNYRINGVSLVKAKVDTNTSDMAIVNLYVLPGSIPYNSNYLVTINGVKGYNNSYNPIEDFTQTIPLTENAAPTVKFAKLVDGNTVVITFSEAVTGTANFNVYMNGTILIYADSIYSTFDSTANTVTLYLGTTLNSSAGITLVPTAKNNLVDATNLKAEINSVIYVN